MTRAWWLEKPSEQEFIVLSIGAVGLAYVVMLLAARGFVPFDFAAFRSAGHAVLHGQSPYPPATPHAIWLAKQLVYPAIVAYLFVPFALVPAVVGGVVFTVLLAGAMLATFAVLGVRDRRCYVVPFIAWPMATALGNGAFGPLLALALAVVWVHRDRTRVVAPVLALAIVAKLFLWPVCFWLLATRRFKSFAATAIGVGLLFFVPFIPLGLPTLRHYFRVLHVLDTVYGALAYTPHALFRSLGASARMADVAMLGLGTLLAIGIVLLVRADRQDAAFAMAIVAALLLTPIAWPHYYVLLYAALGICRPRLSAAWLAPLAFYISPTLNTGGDPWHVGIGLAITACVLVACIRPERPRVSKVRPNPDLRELPGDLSASTMQTW